jgi:hypothetical protein
LGLALYLARVRSSEVLGGAQVRYQDAVENYPCPFVISECSREEATRILFPVTEINNCEFLISGDFDFPVDLFTDVLVQLSEDLPETSIGNTTNHNERCFGGRHVLAPKFE